MRIAHRSRRAHLPAGFPTAWRAIIASRLAAWSTLGEDERVRLEQLVLGLIADVRWSAANGFELTEEVMVTVAAPAALLVLGEGLGIGCFSNVTSIEVHASAILVRGEQHTGLPGGLMFDGVCALAGRADYRGPVFVAWDQVLRDARHPLSGHNVVLHEFAHVLDMLDGVVDGTPPLPSTEMARWVEVCLAEFEALRIGGGDDLLDDYAATDPGEFFAVATEVFFGRPVALRERKPALYAVLAGFYRQDPAARVANAAR